MTRSSYPRKFFPKVCGHCKRDYLAFRTTAEYCGDVCRAQARHARIDRNDVVSVTAKFENKCAECGQTFPKMYVRYDVRVFSKVLLCPRHFTDLSRFMFLQRVPNPGKGYAKRLYYARRDAEAAEIAKRCT